VNPSKLEESESAKDRLRESRHAATSIADHPLLGIGPAGDYGAVVDNWPRETTKPRRYVHNQYLALAVFYGIPALLLFMAIPLAVGAAGLRAVRRTQDELLQVVLAAALGTLAAVLLSSLVHIEFLLPETSLSFFFLLGVVLGAGILGAVEPVPGRAPSSEAAMAEVSA
jgi:O-antigen ligase